MTLKHHSTGNYSFVPGIAPYSCGVVADRGFEIVHATLQTMVPWKEGFGLIQSFLAREQRPNAALCAVSLRSPKPFTFAGFAEFNSGYAAVLRDWGVFVDGINPVARTNVAPKLVPPQEPSLYGFAYTRPCANDLSPTFVVAGAGELPEGMLNREAIVKLGDTTEAGVSEKAAFVMDLMEDRLRQLQTDWRSVTRINVYTIHDLDTVSSAILLPRVGGAGIHGLTLHCTRPPIDDIEFEMDVRGVRTEIILP